MLVNIKNQIHQIFINPVFLSCVTSWFFAQLVKTLIKLLTGKVSSIKELFSLLLWRTGGMPSSHSALVVSVGTSIGFRHGFDSDLCILATCFALVVVRDALGVRRASGTQAKAINDLGEELDRKDILDFSPIKVIQGHKPLEVIIGCFLGFFISLAFATL
ncbi:MAG: divergent PAP2 family protein [Spirochaetaceae bacterium]|jgi:acid phosphatase family membrane protein YuiD|nr:divergent PAP2 family protein [Spirochaetaceae bacterium]